MRCLNATVLTTLLIANMTIVAGRIEPLSSSAALAPVSILLNQPEAPLEILDYSARYNEGRIDGQEEGIDHRANYQNVGDRRIIAVEIVFLSFDIWNELFDRTERTIVQHLDLSAEYELKWLAPVRVGLEGSSFHTAVSYVSRVRFENGEIWSADVSEIAAVLVKVAPAIPPSSL